MGFDMYAVLFLLSVLAVTVYLVVTAWEDHKTCMVTRWKHLIGGIPAIIMYFLNINTYAFEENTMILVFVGLYIVIGCVGVYGFADGIVLAVLTLFFGGSAGMVGAGIVLVIMILAAFSFLICHVMKSVATHGKLFQNVTGALVPHILVGYIVVWILLGMNIV